jgi:hypothetical protein
MKNLLIIFWIFILFHACTEDQKNESPENTSFANLEKFSPQPDYSTPEKLIKSFWKYRIWSDTVYRFDTSAVTLYRFYSQEFYGKQSTLVKRKLNELKEKGHYLIQSVIDKIENQSDSRVIVYTKEFGYEGDENFDNRKYVIVKENNKWSIEDCLSECWSCDGTGKDKYGSHSVCEYCKGLGWRSMVFIQ